MPPPKIRCFEVRLVTLLPQYNTSYNYGLTNVTTLTENNVVIKKNQNNSLSKDSLCTVKTRGLL